MHLAHAAVNMPSNECTMHPVRAESVQEPEVVVKKGSQATCEGYLHQSSILYTTLQLQGRIIFFWEYEHISCLIIPKSLETQKWEI